MNMDIYERIFEYTPDALLVVNEAGYITRANAQTEQMFGFNRDELIGRTIEILIPQRFATGHVGHRSGYQRGPRPRPMGAGFELFGRRKDDSEFPVDIMLSPVETEEGRQVLCAVRNVSDRNRADEARARLAAIVESAADAIIGKDLNGVILSWNPAAERLFGYRAEEVIGKHVTLLIPPEHADEESRILEHIRLGVRVEPYESVRLRKDGSIVDVWLTTSPVKDMRGNVIGASKIVRDISERKRVEQKILDSLREKEVLLQEIHHRVKNNLAVISSLFYLQATYTSDEPTIKILKESQDRVRSMALVHESLYGSQNLAAVDFAEYARRLSVQLVQSYSLPAGEIHLSTDMAPVRMSIDLAVPCGLILNELVTNAVKHAFPGSRGGRIDLALHCNEDGTGVLIVADDGIGLPPDLVVEKSPSLGLRLIRSLARQIDARFELLPAHPGTQARLTLRIDHDDKTH
ncbi:sensor histidine kinase [Methylococcus sp. EFPC2]|uniref:sensor histidine kinase n=1 Tax=Methylococcus sp. EFPC2 TaxID=2812648 RepID=UPI001966F1C6|nr:PAS domain S-box protein [Methylococcus sp. EFPC2]QSA98480.1 PAS domain S-box protein [Methylococcus sp. EFPC2]